MAVLVIAGSGRGSGKTAVGCALIAAMPELRWAAVKVTPHGHGAGEACWEERERDSDKDTGRYLKSGAAQAFLVSHLLENSAESMLEVVRQLHGSGSLLVESNRIEAGRIAQAEEPAACLLVLACAESEWKPSVWGCMGSVDALVLAGGFTPDQLPAELRRKRVFCLPIGGWSTPELIRFVRARFMESNR